MFWVWTSLSQLCEKQVNIRESKDGERKETLDLNPTGNECKATERLQQIYV